MAEEQTLIAGFDSHRDAMIVRLIERSDEMRRTNEKTEATLTKLNDVMITFQTTQIKTQMVLDQLIRENENHRKVDSEARITLSGRIHSIEKWKTEKDPDLEFIGTVKRKFIRSIATAVVIGILAALSLKFKFFG